MSQWRIVLADSSDLSRQFIKNVLLANGHLVYEARDGGSAIRLCRALAPDLVIADLNLANINGFEVGRIINEDDIAPVILMTSTLQRDFLEEIRKYSVFSYLLKPVDRGVLLSTVEFVIENYKKFRSMKEEIQKLKHELEARKKIEKAKGYIMKAKGLSEEEAYKIMRKMSMDMSIPMEIIAEMILQEYKE
ncbi:Response regulator receiver and ANTAR domain protein [Thermoanaerobacter thermohydrosulfuricus WC1]|uniref:Stage 0 sporulation protein A homolog n=2 Tax=Thermoanaerobacter TaxID=1754 RepID=I9KV91_9THEO|nr:MULTISPECIES: ANTAR domain-containing protein [Thermoanaerobacter]EIW00821.1 response regulator with putative antiterminator output domain [Thermoanaerobacter siderophilus SR4]EMT40099.1 Response regulator receiver and ANTAR domain protein [Thermoanaerobacter thermohydrosulfuricus WC1]SFE17132.1 response regulator receiver and ANTAR domain protein [Thermoanaerobacter thermohydrosulfuricus]